MTLSPYALDYARCALRSLVRNTSETLDLRLLADSYEDKERLIAEIARLGFPEPTRCRVDAKDDLADREEDIFSEYPNLRKFRNGHPCWRKLTDPILLSAGDEEMVVIDPDLYFPNRFCFPPTPGRGVALMWQRPNGLAPPSVVAAALSEGIPLARHVDIGVAQWRGPVDLDWLEWLIAKLGGDDLPIVMHVEAIVWAALAMKLGGGYLPPASWRCWRRTQPKRLLRRLGVPGAWLLRPEPFSSVHCFHAGGEAKFWLAGATHSGARDYGGLRSESQSLLPFVELTAEFFLREQKIKRWLRKLGYYHVFQSA